MTSHQFRGIGVAMVTPFLDNGDIDFASLERLIQHVIAGNADYLVMLGTTGEASTMSREERFSILDFTVQANSGRLPIIAGFSGNDTQAVVNDITAYHFNGIAGVLSVNPHYSRPNQEGIFQHYRRIAQYCPVPIMLYNVPSRTGSNIKAETTLRIAREIPNVMAIKEASGDMAQCAEIIRLKERKDFLVLSGDDFLSLPLIALGADGVVSVAGNAYPDKFANLTHTALNGDFEAARHLHHQLTEFIQLIFADGNPAGIKAALSIMNICRNTLRLPLVPVNNEVYQKIDLNIKMNKFI